MFLQRVSYQIQHPQSGYQHPESMKPLRWEKPSLLAEFRAVNPSHQQPCRRLNHASLGGLKATKAELQSTLKRQMDLFHSHSCFSQGTPPEPPCSFYAPASTNQAADESMFLDQSFEVSLDQKKKLCWREELLEGEKGRNITHPPSHILLGRVLDLQPQKLQD